MKTKLFILVLSICLFVSSVSIQHSKKRTSSEEDKVLISVVNYMLTRGHFVQKELNDEFSELVFANFIRELDPSKKYFTKKDIKDFSKYKYQIDNQLKKSDITITMH